MPQKSDYSIVRDARKYDSGRVVRVLHPSGEVRDVPVPEDMDLRSQHDLADFHEKLGNMGFHHPTREGAIEYSPAFRAAAKKAIMASHNYTGQEAGFAVRSSGEPSKNAKGEPVIQSTGEFGKGRHLNVITQGDDMAVFHTHPAGEPRPSPGDINDAKKNHMTVMASSPNGLYEVGPDGKPQQVFKSGTWYDDLK